MQLVQPVAGKRPGRQLAFRVSDTRHAQLGLRRPTPHPKCVAWNTCRRSQARAEPVTITARVTDPDGVQAGRAAYQLVNPGDYFTMSDPGTNRVDIRS